MLWDIKLKKDIKNIDEKEALKKIKKMCPKEFTWIKNEKKDVGLIAQYIEKIWKELIDEQNDIKNIRYANIIPYLISVAKYQNKQIKKIKNEIKKIKLKNQTK